MVLDNRLMLLLRLERLDVAYVEYSNNSSSHGSILDLDYLMY